MQTNEKPEDNNEYNWKTHIFFGEFIAIDKKHLDRIKKFFIAGELPFIDKIVSKCKGRGGTWSEEVSRRISLSIDLMANNVICHQQCKSIFLTKKDVPGQGQSKITPRPPSNKPMIKSFKTFSNWVDGQTKLYTFVKCHE